MTGARIYNLQEKINEKESFKEVMEVLDEAKEYSVKLVELKSDIAKVLHEKRRAIYADDTIDGIDKLALGDAIDAAIVAFLHAAYPNLEKVIK